MWKFSENQSGGGIRHRSFGACKHTPRRQSNSEGTWKGDHQENVNVQQAGQIKIVGSKTFDRTSEHPAVNLHDLCEADNMHWQASELGTCGVFFAYDSIGNTVAVFKPKVEEHIPETFRQALIMGENLYRERAAFILSSELLGHWDVPETVICTVKNTNVFGGEQLGSLQRFVQNAPDMTDMGPSGLPVDQVHKIGCLDLLLFNLDRHEGNILVKTTDNRKQLIPIDHGLCLPHLITRESGPSKDVLGELAFVWESWPQAKQSFGATTKDLAKCLSSRKINSIASVIKKDTPTISLQALTALKVGAVLLRTCVSRGLTLCEVASVARKKAWEEACDAHECHHSEWERQLLDRLEANLAVEVLAMIEQRNEPSKDAKSF